MRYYADRGNHMDRPERQKTANFVKEKVNALLDDENHTSALLFSSIYVNLRLRTLLTEYLSPAKNKWRGISEKLDIGFNRLLSLCDEFGLLHGFNKKPLTKLWEKRCKIAHESSLWKKVPPKEKEAIKNLCESAIDFLENTVR